MTNNKNPQKCSTPSRECDNETLDEIMKVLEKYDIAEEFISIVALGIRAEHEKEKMQRKIEQLNSQYPISPFQTNV